ncbi:hypothetical protein YB2330_004588 [Saitoella coloradoensis]
MEMQKEKQKHLRLAREQAQRASEYQGKRLEEQWGARSRRPPKQAGHGDRSSLSSHVANTPLRSAVSSRQDGNKSMRQGSSISASDLQDHDFEYGMSASYQEPVLPRPRFEYVEYDDNVEEEEEHGYNRHEDPEEQRLRTSSFEEHHREVTRRRLEEDKRSKEMHRHRREQEEAREREEMEHRQQAEFEDEQHRFQLEQEARRCEEEEEAERRERQVVEDNRISKAADEQRARQEEAREDVRRRNAEIEAQLKMARIAANKAAEQEHRDQDRHKRKEAWLGKKASQPPAKRKAFKLVPTTSDEFATSGSSGFDVASDKLLEPRRPQVSASAPRRSGVPAPHGSGQPSHSANHQRLPFRRPESAQRSGTPQSARRKSQPRDRTYAILLSDRLPSSHSVISIASSKSDKSLINYASLGGKPLSNSGLSVSRRPVGLARPGAKPHLPLPSRQAMTASSTQARMAAVTAFKNDAKARLLEKEGAKYQQQDGDDNDPFAHEESQVSSRPISQVSSGTSVVGRIAPPVSAAVTSSQISIHRKPKKLKRQSHLRQVVVEDSEVELDLGED